MVTLKRPEILIIDDDVSSLEIIYRKVFEREGYKVLTANSGRAGLDLLKREAGSPDLILVDCSMPEMNGESFLLTMKEELPQMFLDVKVVGFTSFHSGSTSFKRIKDLAFEFREKPADIAGILRLASDYLGASPKRSFSYVTQMAMASLKEGGGCAFTKVFRRKSDGYSSSLRRENF